MWRHSRLRLTLAANVRVLFEYGGSALQGGLKFREPQDVDEVLRLLLTEVARNPVRKHTTPIERGLRPGFLDGTMTMSLSCALGP
jgi:hypothetical protein